MMSDTLTQSALAAGWELFLRLFLKRGRPTGRRNNKHRAPEQASAEVYAGFTDRYSRRPRHWLSILCSYRPDCRRRPCPSTICCRAGGWSPSPAVPKWPVRYDRATANLQYYDSVECVGCLESIMQ